MPKKYIVRLSETERHHLAGRVVELGIVPAISHETVRKLIKKTD